jgi:hypothetical protein
MFQIDLSRFRPVSFSMLSVQQGALSFFLWTGEMQFMAFLYQPRETESDPT